MAERSNPSRQNHGGGQPRLCIDLSNTIEAPSVSGVQRVTIGLSRALSELAPVTLLDGRSGRLRPVPTTARRRLDRLQKGASGRTVPGRIESRLARELAVTRPLRFGPDTVLVDLEASWHAPQLRAELLPTIAGAPTAALLYDVLPITNPGWFPPRSVERFASWFRAHVAAGSTLLAISEATADATVEVAHDVERPAVIRLGGHADGPTNTGPISAGSGVLMVGTVEPRKGHDLLLDALDLLGDRAPTVDVVGRPGWASDELIDRLDTHPRVRWHRDVTDTDLAELWALTGLLLQPSRGEGYGLPIAEGLQRGIAVVASDLPVLHEAARGRALHLPLDPVPWADTLAAYAADPAAWPRPEPLAWPSWRDGAHDVMTALTAAGQWPEGPQRSR